MHIEVWSLGKANESYIEQGIQNYFKKIKYWNSIDLVLLQYPKKEQNASIERIMQLEEELVLKRLQAQHYLIVLDERGKLYNSIQWSEQFQQFRNQGVKQLVFLIGGAYGISPTIKSKAAQIWSLSPLVFPHQLVRLLMAEQIYRALSILHHSPYHHS